MSTSCSFSRKQFQTKKYDIFLNFPHTYNAVAANELETALRENRVKWKWWHCWKACRCIFDANLKLAKSTKGTLKEKKSNFVHVVAKNKWVLLGFIRST